MPLDPSIFLQGAALRQRNNEMLLSSLQNTADQSLKRKALEIEQNTKGFDIEKLAQGYQLKKNMGVETTPQEKAAFDTYVQFESAERAVDPVTGNLYQKFQWPGGGGIGSVDPGASDIGTIHEFPQNAPKRTGFNLDMMGSPSPTGVLGNPPQQFAGGFAIPPVNPADYEGLPTNQPANPLQKLDASMISGTVPGGFNMDAIRPVVSAPPPTGNRKLDQDAAEKAQSMNMELQRDEIKKKVEPLNDTQGKAATFADRMMEADKVFADPKVLSAQKDLMQRGASSIPGVGNFLVSDDFQSAEQAERNFINATLRRESGAVINPEEFVNARKQYIPQPGDSDKVLKQKAENRKTIIEGFGRDAGPAYKPKTTAVERVTPSGVKYKVIE